MSESASVAIGSQLDTFTITLHQNCVNGSCSKASIVVQHTFSTVWACKIPLFLPWHASYSIALGA